MARGTSGRGDMEALTRGEQELAELARSRGVIGPHDEPSSELLDYALAIVQACAEIGDGYWRDDASAGQHIRATYYP